MILNVQTVVALFLAATGAVLALAAAVVAVRSLGALRRDSDGDRMGLYEDRAHLLALIIGVLAAVRFIAWPFFYALLDSYVPDLAIYGVMCSFGVTLIDAPFVTAVQWLKPIVLFALGLWGLLAIVERRAGAPVLLGPRIALALPIAVAALADCGVEITYLLREKVGQPVTCCTRFRDTDAAALADNLSPLSKLGMTSSASSLGVLFVFGVALVGIAWLASRRRGGTLSVPAAAIAIGGAINLFVTHWSWIDAVAPRVLGLPYHHCLYELLTGTPGLGVAALLAVVGSAGLIWPALLAPWRQRAPAAIAAVQQAVYGVCAVALLSALLIVGVAVA